jgi:hypothetical protein
MLYRAGKKFNSVTKKNKIMTGDENKARDAIALYGNTSVL